MHDAVGGGDVAGQKRRDGRPGRAPQHHRPSATEPRADLREEVWNGGRSKRLVQYMMVKISQK